MMIELDLRQEYVIAQALALAIWELSNMPAPYKEESNIHDMEDLLHGQFGSVADLAITAVASHEGKKARFPQMPSVN